MASGQFSGPQSCVTVPPAAVIFSLAVAEKAWRVSAHAFSATAREKITAAGGTVTQL